MEIKKLKYMKQHYKFETWYGCNTLKENLFIWNYFLNGSEFPGWQIHSNQPMTAHGWPRFIHSSWGHRDSDIEIAMRVDIYECVSRVKAHEFMLQLLEQFSLPGVERHKKKVIGDVAFSNPEDTVILFARANCVLLLSNAGRKLISASDEAQPIDLVLCRKPEITRKAETISEIHRFRISATEREVGVGEIVPMRLEVSDILHPNIFASLKEKISTRTEIQGCFKFFSDSGEVYLEKGCPVYKPESAGRQKVTVYAIDVDSGVSRQTCQFNAI